MLMPFRSNRIKFVSFESFACIVVLLGSTNIGINTRWMQNGVTIAGGNDRGDGLNQLSSSWSIFVNDDQTVYIVLDICAEYHLSVDHIFFAQECPIYFLTPIEIDNNIVNIAC